MKNKLIAVLVLALAVLALPAASFAQSTTVPPRRAEKCTDLKLRVDQRIANYRVRHEKRLDRWNRASVILNNVIDKLQAKGYNTSVIEQDQADMQGYMDALGDSYDTIMGDYNSFRSIDCSDTAGFQAAFDKLQADNEAGNVNLQAFLEHFRKSKQDLLSYKSMTPAPTAAPQ